MNIEIEKPRPTRIPENVPPQPMKESPDLRGLFRRPLAADLESLTGFHSGPRARRKGYRLASWSWVAALIDALILISLSSLFLIVFSVIMKTGAGAVLHNVKTHQSLGESFFGVFLLSSWLYMITLRVFIGSSIGEWACDLRMGRLQDRLQRRYPWRVILRATVVLGTGLVTMPLLFLLTGHDLAGRISGVSLFSLK